MQDDAPQRRAVAVDSEAEIERIRACARQSIGRGVLFGLLAIAATIGGLIGWPVVAMRIGAISSMLMIAVLALRALCAGGRPYRRTETWLLLGRAHSLPEARAQAVITRILAETYWYFAGWAAALAAIFWIAAFAFALLRG
jgi:hypothetical protein